VTTDSNKAAGCAHCRIEAVYLDMDGVLADFVTGSILALGRDPAEVLPKVTPGDYDGIYSALGMAENEFWEKIDALAGGHAPGAGLWGDLAPYPWRDAVLAACRKVAPTWILTSPSRSPGSSFGKVSWLQAWLGPKFRDYILTPRKWHVARPGTLLIDDSDRNVKKWRKHGGMAILFPRLWNSAHASAGNAMDVLSEELAKLEPCTGSSARPS
jgi:hypothetical protein